MGAKKIIFNEDEEKYIQHEVKLRLHDERFVVQDEKFSFKIKEVGEKFDYKLGLLEKRMDEMDNKLNWLLGLMLGSLILSALIKWSGWLG